MAQPAPSNLIYLPAGVIPPQPAASAAAPGSNAPFNRHFFAEQLPQAIESFCKQADCNNPTVELLTVDGQRHWVSAISGASDAWVALQVAREDHDHPIEAFIPYGTIFRVEIHASADERQRRLGFRAMLEAKDGPRVARPPANAGDGHGPAPRPDEAPEVVPAAADTDATTQ